MNIKILAQNIVNNPSDFTAEQIERYFEDYAELRLSSVSFAKRNVCSMGIDYEKCSEHPLNELGCYSCEKYIEQT